MVYFLNFLVLCNSSSCYPNSVSNVFLNFEFRMIDSAQAYNESAVGLALKASPVNRDDVFIVSKIHPKNLGYDTTIESVLDSLANLQTEYIDLMLIHSKDCDEGIGAHLACGEGEPKGDWVETWKALEFMVDKGTLLQSSFFIVAKLLSTHV